jgi:hypothetical protein
MDREGSKRITTKQDFLSKVNSLAGAMDFNANEPLNIARYKHKTEGEKLYDKEVETQKERFPICNSVSMKLMTELKIQTTLNI